MHRTKPLVAAALAAGAADGTSTVVADGRGNVVCSIQSLFNEWGSRELAADTGVLLNDRLADLAVDEHLPNGLRGGRRPLHTLNTYMVLEDGVPVLAGPTPRGRGQVQTNLQVLVNVLDFGMDVQGAVDTPRWTAVRTIGRCISSLRFQPKRPMLCVPLVTRWRLASSSATRPTHLATAP